MHYKVVHVADVTQEMEQAASDANSLFGNWPAVIRAAIHDAPDTGMVAVRRDVLVTLVRALRIANDWNITDVQCYPPTDLDLPAINEDTDEGWCSTLSLAEMIEALSAGVM